MTKLLSLVLLLLLLHEHMIVLTCGTRSCLDSIRPFASLDSNLKVTDEELELELELELEPELEVAEAGPAILTDDTFFGFGNTAAIRYYETQDKNAYIHTYIHTYIHAHIIQTWNSHSAQIIGLE